jgi:hypothetical protein
MESTGIYDNGLLLLNAAKTDILGALVVSFGWRT